jgi:hypothetical protein
MGGLLHQPISYTEISQYAQDHGYDEDFDEFVRLVIAQDEVYLAHHAELRKKEAEKERAKAQKGPPRRR